MKGGDGSEIIGDLEIQRREGLWFEKFFFYERSDFMWKDEFRN